MTNCIFIDVEIFNIESKMKSNYKIAKCKICNKKRKVYKNLGLCPKCNATAKWESDKQEIVKNIHKYKDRIFTILLGNIYVNVTPDKIYNGIKGIDLIAKYLNRTAWKYGCVRTNDNVRKAKSRHREKRYGTLSQHDIERASKLGNVLDDKSFAKYQEKLSNMSEEEAKNYINSFVALDNEDFTTSNEGLTSRYSSYDELREAEMDEQEAYGDDYTYWDENNEEDEIDNICKKKSKNKENNTL